MPVQMPYFVVLAPYSGLNEISMQILQATWNAPA